MTEVIESFMDHMSTKLELKRKLQPPTGWYGRSEKIGKRNDTNVALARFLDSRWNMNGDDWISVYELAAAMAEHTIPHDEDALHWSLEQITAEEQSFCTNVQFQVKGVASDKIHGEVKKLIDTFAFSNYQEELGEEDDTKSTYVVYQVSD